VDSAGDVSGVSAHKPRVQAVGGHTREEGLHPAAISTAVTEELTGELPCVRCGYNLRGLSVRGTCPECATPVAATVLAVVDPLAAEIQPIAHRRLVAAGLLAWSWLAAGAVLAMWVLRLFEVLNMPRPSSVDRGVLVIVPAFLALSCLGLVSIIRPHGSIPRGWSIAAVGAVLTAASVAVATAVLLWKFDGVGGRPYFGPFEPTPARELLAGAISVLVAAEAALARQNFHVLLARSHLLRTGQIERQTLRAVIFCSLAGACGHLMHALAPWLQPQVGDVVTIAGTCVLGVGSLLLTLGLIGVAVDCRRLLPVILAPPLRLADVMAGSGAWPPPGSSQDPSGAPREPAGA